MADTDRNGTIDAADQAGRYTVTRTRGAIYNVNLDKDNSLPDYPLPGYDPADKDYLVKLNDGLSLGFDGTIPHLTDGSFPTEDLTINGASDVPDITPFKIHITQASGWRYFLTIDQSCVRAIHVFPSLAPGETRILGGPTLSGSPTANGGGPPILEKEITSGFSNGNLDRTFGLEGLAFRGMELRESDEPRWTGAPFAGPYQFSGMATISVEARQYDASGNVAQSVVDTIRLKVAPFVLRSNIDPSSKAWAIDDPLGKPLRDALVNTGQAGAVQYREASGSQWLQDHCEIGYTNRPGQSIMNCVFELPYGSRPYWAQNLAGPNACVFQIGRALFTSSDTPAAQPSSNPGDFGGNVECIPPTYTHPLGEILIGDTCSDALLAFLENQEVQPIVTIPTKWLNVGHVDEMLQFLPDTQRTGYLQCVVASPDDAYTRMGIDVNPYNRPFFTDHRNAKARPNANVPFTGTGAVFSGQPYQGLQMTVPGMNPMFYDPQNPGETTFVPQELYIRFLTGSPGLTLKIDSIDFTTGRYSIGDGYLLATQVMDETDNTSNVFARYSNVGGDEQALHSGALSVQLGKITTSDEFMIMDGSKSWATPVAGNLPASYTPAGVSLAELNADPYLRAYNAKVAAKIQVVRDILEDATSGSVEFIPVPTLFKGEFGAKFDDGGTGVAFTPGIANLQVVGDRLLAPDPLAPPAFTQGLANDLSGLVLVDDWDLYHRLEGEVHCGTNVARPGPPAVYWWTQLP